MRYILTLLLVTLMSGLFTAKNTVAQQKETWPVTCKDKSNAETCIMSQSRYGNIVIDGKSQNNSKILTLTVLYAINKETKKRSPYLGIQMPLGISLEANALFVVDKNKAIQLPILQCTNSGCDSSIVLNKKLLRTILVGREVSVVFKIWGRSGQIVVKSPLTGFTKSFRKLK